MAASIHNLQSQARSLQAYTEALQVTGRNIAGSGDANYSRQDVTLQSTKTGSNSNRLGSSVSASVKSTRDQLVETQIWREQSELGFNKETLSYLERLEVELFSASSSPLAVTADGGEFLNQGLISYVNNFFSSWADLEASPHDTAAQQAVYDSAESLIDRLHLEADSLGDLKATISSGISKYVERVNDHLAAIGSLQQKLAGLPTGSTSAKAELISQRDQQLSALSEYIPFTWSENESSPLESRLNVRLADGTTANMITGSSVTDTLNWDGSSLSVASSGVGLVADSGKLGAAVRMVSNVIPQYENQRDGLAAQIGGMVNTVYNPAGTTGLNFFNPNTLFSASTISLEVADAGSIQAGTGGTGNDIAGAIADLLEQDLTGIGGFNGTISDVLLTTQDQLAREINAERDKVSAQETVMEFLQQEKDQRSGVDLDYEVTQLLQFQRSFQATSRVLRTLDDVMQTFLNDIA